jgi:hypothetical protein
MQPVDFVIIILVLIILYLGFSKKEHLEDQSYWSPFESANCKLNPYFHGNGYDYGNHRFNKSNMRGMRIGYGYMHDGTMGEWTNFPIIWYTMKGCRYCNEFENSGVWDRLKKEYGKDLKFEVVDKTNAPAYITSFPTFVAEVGDKKLVYNGNRDVVNMRQWINSLMIKKLNT